MSESLSLSLLFLSLCMDGHYSLPSISTVRFASTFFTHFHAPYFIISSVSVSFPLHLLIFFFFCFFQIYSSSFTTDQNRETAWKNLQPIAPILRACVCVCPCIYTSISICVYLYTSSLLSLLLGFFLYEKLGSFFDLEWKVVVGSFVFTMVGLYGQARRRRRP